MKKSARKNQCYINHKGHINRFLMTVSGIAVSNARQINLEIEAAKNKSLSTTGSKCCY